MDSNKDIKYRKKRVLSLYRHYFFLNRGTPLRIKSLIGELIKSNQLELYTASRDEGGFQDVPHIQLTGSNFENIKKIDSFIKKNEIDIVVFHTLSAGYYLLPLLLLRSKFKRVIEMHGFLEEESRLYGDISILKYYRNKFIYSLIYKMSDMITTCSKTASEKIRKYNKRTYTVFGGVNLQKFNPSIVPYSNIRSSIQEVVIGYSGNARKWQGLDFLLEAFSKVHTIDPDFSLRLLLSEEDNNIDMPGVTVYSGVPHEEVAMFNASCDILVIPRTSGIVNTLSFPSKVMEYLAMGKPVVSSRTSDVHKIIKHKENGLLFNPDDIDGLVSCLLLLKDPLLRKRIGRDGYETVANEYTWKIQGEKFTGFLEALYQK